ncbi:MAG: hypothetical protein PHQ04_08830 [Opitutaceae bacterium]|nr:hypothetical protein [Opitutaceae bacterium]
MAHPFRSLISCCLIGASCVLGQENARPGLQIKFTVFSAKPIADLAYALPVGPTVRTVAVQFHPTARSPRYDYSGPGPLCFFDLKTDELIAEVKIPSHIKEALLIFQPQAPEAAAATPGCRVFVFDDAAICYGAGQLMVLNFSGLPLAGTLGRQHIDLNDGANGPYSIGRGAPILLRTTYRQKSYQAYAATIELGRNGRALLILMAPFYRGSLEVQSRLLIEKAPAPSTR